MTPFCSINPYAENCLECQLRRNSGPANTCPYGVLDTKGFEAKEEFSTTMTLEELAHPMGMKTKSGKTRKKRCK